MSLFDRLFSAGVHARPVSVTADDLSALPDPAVPIRVDELRWKGELAAQRAVEASAAGKALLAVWTEQQAAESTSSLDLDRVERLRGALRCTENSSPLLHRLVRLAQRTLGREFPYEVYLEGFVDLNASCQWARDRLLISFTDGLLHAMSPGELAFVVGHEIGHYLSPDQRFGAFLYSCLQWYEQYPDFRDEDARRGDPVAQTLYRKGFPELVLAERRHAEITCDRCGLLTCRRLEWALSAMAKLTAGTGGGVVQITGADFLSQAEELIATRAAWDEDDSSHPLSLLRAKALHLFYQSQWYGQYYPHADVLHTVADADQLTEELFALRSDDALTDLTSPSSDTAQSGNEANALFLDLLSFAAYIVASVDGKITPSEERAVEALRGGPLLIAHWDALEQLSETDAETRWTSLAKRAAVELPRRRLATLVRYLVRVAKADRRMSDTEVRCILGIASAIGVEDLGQRHLENQFGRALIDAAMVAPA